jgi:hypothetical protein
VSLLSSKYVTLSLGTRSIRASLHAKWSPDKVLALSRHVLDAVAASLEPDGEAVSREACIGAVQGVLTELKASAALIHIPLKVQISDALAHFDVVAGDFAESSDRQLQAIASACVDDLLDDHTGPQVVRWQLQADARHLLIASLDASTIEAIVQEAARHEMPLETLQPEFCNRWNLYSGDLSGGTAIFASVADGTVVMALVEQGSITALSTGAWSDIEGTPKAALDQRADRLVASQGVDPNDLACWVLVAPEDEVPAPSTRWTVVRLEGASA